MKRFVTLNLFFFGNGMPQFWGGVIQLYSCILARSALWKSFTFEPIFLGRFSPILSPPREKKKHPKSLPRNQLKIVPDSSRIFTVDVDVSTANVIDQRIKSTPCSVADWHSITSGFLQDLGNRGFRGVLFMGI